MVLPKLSNNSSALLLSPDKVTLEPFLPSFCDILWLFRLISHFSGQFCDCGLSKVQLKRALYLKVQTELFTYKCLEAEGKRGLLFEAVNLPAIPEIPPSPKPIQELIDYVTVAPVRNLLKIACNELRDLSGDVEDIEQYTTQSYIGYRIKGKRVFASLHPRRDSFWIDTNDEEGEWKGHKIQTEDDYRRVLSNVKRTYKVFDGQAILEEEITAEEGDF